MGGCLAVGHTMRCRLTNHCKLSSHRNATRSFDLMFIPRRGCPRLVALAVAVVTKAVFNI
jgi:hypothetical protein